MKIPERKTSPQLKKTRPRREEFTLYGWNSCKAYFASDPQGLFRLFFSAERSKSLREEKKWCQVHKIPYRELDAKSLNKVAASSHHEGVVMVVKPLPKVSANRLALSGKFEGLHLALDRVGNPHNVGAILRTCGFFGVKGLILGKEEQAQITSSAARMAEGAWGQVTVYDSQNLASSLREMRQRGMFVLGTDPSAKKSLFESDISFPCLLVIGNESEGISPAVRKHCDLTVGIPGNGNIQSLNLSVSAGILIAEIFRRKL